jgi:hypothetical protein
MTPAPTFSSASSPARGPGNPPPPKTPAQRFAALFRRSLPAAESQSRWKVAVGERSLNFGKVVASGNSGAYHRLYDACKEHACDTGPISF